MSDHIQTTVTAGQQLLPAASSSGHAAQKGVLPLQDNRLGASIQRKQVEALGNKPAPVVQKKENNTGLPDQLKSGIENLSGYAMDDVKVHYNSAQPAQLQAHAYAQGADIHVAPGQEKHLPHEAWHVVQQKQGRVKPTMQLKSKVNVNDDKGLENEADVMGSKALQLKIMPALQLQHSAVFQNKRITQRQSKGVIQRVGGLLGWGRDLWFGGATAAGAAAGGYYGATTLGAAGAQMGGMLGSILGPAGTVAGGIIGGGLGLIGGGLLGYGGYNLASKGITLPEKTTNAKPPSLGTLMYGRAESLATRDKKDLVNGPLDYLPGEFREPIGKTRTKGDAMEILDKAYAGSAEKAPMNEKMKSSLREILQRNELIQDALKGDFSKGKVKRTDHDSEEKENLSEAPERGDLQIPVNSGKKVKKAKTMFDRIVTKKLPAITSKQNIADPVSSISATGQLNIGTVATPGVLLHELGHHLEHNLSPEDFGTLHNYLRQESRTEKFRKVGHGGMLKREKTDDGYNVPLPESEGDTESASLLRLAGKGLQYNVTGSGTAEKDIDRFVISHSDSEKSSYATMMYSSHDTEYLSTTIHYFSDPQKLANLIDKNPLRVALFLFLANPKEYNLVKGEFGKKTDTDLDNLIHRVKKE